MSHKTPTLHELLEHFRTAMLITHTGDGHLRARPMVIAGLEPSCLVWLISSDDSAKIHEIEKNRSVHLSMQREGETYLSLDGHADITEDQDKINELWREDYARYFPVGPDDPNIALIAITPERAEYWEYTGESRTGVLSSPDAFVHGTKPEEVTR